MLVVEGVDHLESYFHLLKFLLLVALQVLRQFLLLQVVLELPLLELQEQKLVFQQVLLPQLVFLLLGLEQIEGLQLLLGFELQHW